MKVKIEIDCSDVDEVNTHLKVIRAAIMKNLRKLEKEQPDKKWEPFTIEDNNCYGWHQAVVRDDSGPHVVVGVRKPVEFP